MLLQASLPRPVIRMGEFPKNIVILTLTRTKVSRGDVEMAYLYDVENGERHHHPVEPLRDFPIEGEPGFTALEYVLPTNMLAKRHGNLSLVYGTVGIEVLVQSAYRESPGSYKEHRILFSLHFPVTGGGIVRFRDAPFDLSNPDFDPMADIPKIGHVNEEIRDPGDRMATSNMTLAFNRAHKVDRNAETRSLRRRIRIGEVPATRENLESAGLDPNAADSYPQTKPVTDGGLVGHITYRESEIVVNPVIVRSTPNGDLGHDDVTDDD